MQITYFKNRQLQARPCQTLNVYVDVYWTSHDISASTNYRIRQILNITEYLLVLVLVVNERDSFSAIDVHIFPYLIQTVFEDVH